MFLIDLTKLIAKTTLIFVFLVLGTSWVIELSQLPEATSMKINFINWNIIELSIPSKNILNQIVFNTKYYSSGDFISNNEQIFILLKENDQSNYFIEIKKKLESKIDKTNLQKIIDWNNRWNKK